MGHLMPLETSLNFPNIINVKENISFILLILDICIVSVFCLKVFKAGAGSSFPGQLEALGGL